MTRDDDSVRRLPYFYCVGREGETCKNQWKVAHLAQCSCKSAKPEHLIDFPFLWAPQNNEFLIKVEQVRQLPPPLSGC